MGRYVDSRGTIEDLLQEPLDSVTEIFTVAGAVRGNHVHRETMQWTYVVSGSLLVAARSGCRQVNRVQNAGRLIAEPPGIPHAWQALEDTRVLVFTRGPRSGEDYESDTERLLPADRLL